MREQVEYLKGNPEREYSIAEIREHRLMPWARDYRTIGKAIKRDFFGENKLQARIEGEGRQARYYIRGKHLLAYIEIYGPYLMGTARRPKRTWIQPKQSKRSSKK